jgi:hypothetical protein
MKSSTEYTTMHACCRPCGVLKLIRQPYTASISFIHNDVHRPQRGSSRDSTCVAYRVTLPINIHTYTSADLQSVTQNYRRGSGPVIRKAEIIRAGHACMNAAGPEIFPLLLCMLHG